MGKIRSSLERYASGKTVLLLFLCTQAVYVFMLSVTIPSVMRYSDGMELFDMRPTGYDPEYAMALLAALGQEGRQTYLFGQIPFDMVYPGLFAVAYSLLLLWLFRKGFGRESMIHSLYVVPILAGAFDYLENMGIIAMLLKYPDVPESLARLTNIFSVSKSVFTTLFFLLLLIGAVAFARKKLLSSRQADV